MSYSRAVAALLGLVAWLAAEQVSAQSVADFYKGKTVSILMGTEPGGSYDLYGRLIANNLKRHIPGNPNLVVEHMPGAGGALAANFIFGPSPQDGSKILLSHAITHIEMLEPGPNIRFQSAKFQWIGAYDEIVQVLALWGTAGVTKAEDLLTKPVVVGAMNTSHQSYQWAVLLRDAIGAKFKVIAGYNSGGALNVAMERGEVTGWPVAWDNLTGTKPQWLAEKTVTIPVVFSLERMPQYPDSPTLIELSQGEQKKIAQFISAGTPIARALAFGPGVPADRVAAVRAAFDAMMADPAFKEEAAQRKLNIRYRSAKEVEGLVKEITSASPEFIEKVKAAVAPPK
jgi:tripartite-type tricarboxylate transporter receptor subunit TctC